MSNPNTILNTPALEASFALARHCLAVNAFGIIIGPCGVGKTEALKSLTRYPQLLNSGRVAHYYQASQCTGSTRGIRDLLIDFDVRQAVHQRTTALPVALKLAHHEFETRKIDLLLIDEADLLAIDSLQGIVSMLDYSRQKGHPLTIICAASKPIHKWMGELASGLSRTLRVCQIENLSAEFTCAVLSGWGPPLSDLADGVKKGDKPSLSAFSLIHKSTSGNLRRLYFFAKLAALDPKPLHCERVREVLDLMSLRES